jgi:hypothetical protein
MDLENARRSTTIGRPKEAAVDIEEFFDPA